MKAKTNSKLENMLRRQPNLLSISAEEFKENPQILLRNFAKENIEAEKINKFCVKSKMNPRLISAIHHFLVKEDGIIDYQLYMDSK
ncbi:MAG: hypothetical protein EOO43_25930 [Flavobacterium sp.]|nr:MAG: hypothetical protein EOO43_25930 [Flavobacterium sp.]